MNAAATLTTGTTDCNSCTAPGATNKCGGCHVVVSPAQAGVGVLLMPAAVAIKVSFGGASRRARSAAALKPRCSRVPAAASARESGGTVRWRDCSRSAAREEGGGRAAAEEENSAMININHQANCWENTGRNIPNAIK